MLFTGSNGTRPMEEHSHESANLLNGACRPATLLNYLEQLYPTAPFCAQGSSAGGSAIAYAIAEYG